MFPGFRSGEGRAFDKLHNQVVRTHVVQSADVWMIQRGHRPRLALEPFAEPLGGDFDGDIAMEPGVRGAVDFPHPACANESEDFVGSELRTGGQAHFFNPAVQFKPAVMGMGAGSPF